MILKELCKKHLLDINERINAGKLSFRTKGDYTSLTKIFDKAGIINLSTDSIGPVQFTSLQNVIENTGISLRSQKNMITSIKSLFNWGGPNGMGFIKEMNYGPRFKSPSNDAIEQEQELLGKVRFVDRELILEALAKAGLKMKLAILLGINCAFYPSDTLNVSIDNFHLDCEMPYHDFRRVKTKRKRMAVLWPETVTVIKDYINKERKKWNPDERTLILNNRGYKYSNQGGPYSLIKEFNALVSGISKVNQHAGIGSLRHTYATVVDSVPDQTMINLTMGHTDKSMQKRVYKQFNMDELKRLKVVSDCVRDWLYLP